MDIKRFLITYSKLGAIMLVSFFLASFLNEEVFVNNSPKVRNNLPEHLAGRGQEFIASLPFIGTGGSKTSSQIAKQAEETVNGSLKDIPFSQVAKGVSAKENDELKYTIIKDNEVEWIEYTFMVKGKEVKIKVRAGAEPPPKERIEQLYE